MNPRGHLNPRVQMSSPAVHHSGWVVFTVQSEGSDKGPNVLSCFPLVCNWPHISGLVNCTLLKQIITLRKHHWQVNRSDPNQPQSPSINPSSLLHKFRNWFSHLSSCQLSRLECQCPDIQTDRTETDVEATTSGGSELADCSEFLWILVFFSFLLT